MPDPGGARQSKPLSRAPANCDYCQHGSDKQQLPNLHAHIEEQQSDGNGRLRQADLRERARKFLAEAPMTAAQAAKVILDGVKEDRWRILVGEDAKVIDERVRATPERAYDVDFFEGLAKEIGWKVAR